MKRLLLPFTLLFLFSCSESARHCGQLVCVDDLPQLKLSCPPWDADTVWIIYRDAPGDTITTSAEIITRSSSLRLVEPNDMRRDVTIILPNVNRTYEVTDFKYEKRLCGDCPKQEYGYNAFLGCKVNGKQTGFEVFLQ